MSDSTTSPVTDEAWMQRAITAGWRARRTVTPRPWVGAVVVAADGSTAFDGWTEGRDGPHAEPAALLAAGDAAMGSTLYVTLEPCSHHGRTPPCADAIIAAGVARVVIGVEDPDAQVSGQGVARLRDASVEVSVGIGADDVNEQLAPYLHHRRTGRPYVVLKLATSLDGRIAAPDGTSRWITGEPARLDAHRLRADCDAILVGAGTVRADDPSLTVRLPAGEADGIEPRRLVLGVIPPDAKAAPATSLSGDLPAILDELGREGVVQVLVEGGATVAHDFHAAGLVDRYVLYLAPALFGGDDSRAALAGPGVATIDDLWRGRIVSTRQLGDDLRLDVLPSVSSPRHRRPGLTPEES